MTSKHWGQVNEGRFKIVLGQFDFTKWAQFLYKEPNLISVIEQFLREKKIRGIFDQVRKGTLEEIVT